MKKVTSFILYIIILMMTTQAVAQDSLQSSSLRLSVGSGQVWNKDQFQSPYTYKGSILLLRASYTLSNVKGQHAVGLDFSAGSFKSAVSPAAKNQLAVLRYAYLFRMGSSRTQWTSSLGPGIGTLWSITNYLPGIELPKTYLTNSTVFTLNGLISYAPTTRHQILLDATLPIAGFAYRPDFEINEKTYQGYTSITKHLGLITNLGYEFALNINHKLVLNYQYTYFTYDKPRPITILQHGFTVGFKKQL